MGEVYLIRLVMIFALSTFVDTASLTGKCRDQKYDIGFLVDSSGTVKNKFDKELEIVKEIVKSFNIRPLFNRAGLVSFSDHATTDMARGEYGDVASFNGRVSDLKFQGGRTHIDRGLDEVTNVLFNLNNDKTGHGKILFVLSDGRQTEVNQHEVDLEVHVRDLKRVRVTIMAIAMGNTAERKYLEQLVDDPKKDIVYSNVNTALQTTVQNAIDAACKPRPQPAGPKCDQKIDFGFLLDASGSIGKNNWPKEPRFVMDILKKFEPFHRTDGTRAGVIIYSNEANVDLVITMDEFNKLEEFEKKLNGYKYIPGRLTAISKALTKAKDELFQERNGDSPGIKNFLVLVTDGRQNPPLDADDSLNNYSQPLRDAGVITMAVGIADAVPKEMKLIAGDPSRYFHVDNIDQLTEAVDVIVSKICRSCEVNVGFVLDSSKTTANYFDHEKKVVKYLAARLKLGSSGTKASVTSFSYESEVNIGFDEDQGTLESFDIEVGFLRNIGKRTNIEKGLLAAENEFKHPRNGFKVDQKLPKVIVVLSDGLENEGSVAGTAQRLRNEGFHIVAISLGYPNREVLKAITDGDGKYIFDLAHNAKPNVFNTKIDEVVDGICK